MSILSLLAWIFSLQFTLFNIFMAEGPSMEPTLYSGDLFLIGHTETAEANYERGDIVVFSLDEDPDYFYVKRIVGLPSERIQVRSDGIYIGESGAEVKLEEPYLLVGSESASPTGSYKDDFKQTFNVPNDKYFVLGDNREHSMDSRSFKNPFVEKSQIKGKYINNLINLSMPKPTIIINTDQGEYQFDIEIADDANERELGLMFRTDLPEKKGMFFIFDEPGQLSFWMKNTLIPLDIIFIDSDFNIVHIEANAMPCEGDPCEIYESVQTAKYVFEIGGGQSEVLGIKVGNTVQLIK
jgi:signal peptidase I